MIKKLILSILTSIVLAAAAFAGNITVTLAWDAPLESDVFVHHIMIGNQTGVYTQTFTATNGANQIDVTIPSGNLAYAVCIAENTIGLDSLPSAELVFQLNSQALPPNAPTGFRIIKIIPSL